MKTCEKCGGSGAIPIQVTKQILHGHVGFPGAKLCPCVTERMAKLERVAEAAKHIDWLENAHDASIYIVTTKRADRLLNALAALEETK